MGGGDGRREGAREMLLAGSREGKGVCFFCRQRKKKEKRFFVRLLLVPFFSGGKFESIYSK